MDKGEDPETGTDVSHWGEWSPGDVGVCVSEKRNGVTSDFYRKGIRVSGRSPLTFSEDLWA